MEDKVTKFGNIAHNLVDRIENAVEAISRIDGCKDVFLASKANADLGCLERAWPTHSSTSPATAS